MKRAVVVDGWALLRLGIGEVLRSCGVAVTAEEQGARDGLLRARATDADLVVLGTFADLPLVDAVREAVALPARPRVMALVSGLRREGLSELAAAGPHAVLVRTVEADAMEDAVRRVAAGERVVSPALIPAVVGTMQAGEAGAGGGPLTLKEHEVLVALADGRSNQQIAEALFVTPSTVKTHLAHIYAKLGVKGRHEALTRAIELGLLG
jgi:NarL family two-component system response regulator LiaR